LIDKTTTYLTALYAYDSFANPQSPIELDVSALAKGIYLVKIQSENGVVNKKLVIQ
jgi:hypothetical protein